MAATFPWHALVCVLIGSLSSFSLGLDVGMISSTLIQPTFLDYFDDPSPSATGGIVATFAAGGCVGSLGTAWLADPLGRVWSMRIGAVIAVIGCALQAGAVHLAMLILGRLINGFGAGILIATFPVYASEIAPPRLRGALGGFQMTMISTAIFIATATGYAFGTYYTSNAQWRGPLAVQALPLVLFIPLSFGLPESPRWLIAHGKNGKAKSLLSQLHKGAGQDFVQGEYQEICDQLTAEKELYSPSWLEIIRKPAWRRRILLIAGLQMASQLTGVNCVQYYASTIYKQLGFSTHESLLLNLLYGASGFVFGVFWISIIDKFKRIKVLIVAEIFMSAALLVQSVLSAVYANRAETGQNALRAQVAMFFVFNLFFVAIGVLSWLIPPEMCPMIIRAKANSISVSINYGIGLMVAEVSPIGLAHVQFKFFYLFVASNIVFAILFYLFYPETSGLTLEQIDELFGDNVIDHVLHLPENKVQIEFVENKI